MTLRCEAAAIGGVISATAGTRTPTPGCQHQVVVVRVVRELLLVVVRQRLFGGRERLRLAAVRAGAREHERPVRLVLVEQARVLKARDHRLLALEPRVRDRADLLAVKVRPLLRVELLVERHNGRGLDEVDERVAHVALVLEVDREVEEVVAPAVPRVDLCEQHLLRVLVRDVAHHERRALVGARRHAVNREAELADALVVPANRGGGAEPNERRRAAARPHRRPPTATATRPDRVLWELEAAAVERRRRARPDPWHGICTGAALDRRLEKRRVQRRRRRRRRRQREHRRRARREARAARRGVVDVLLEELELGDVERRRRRPRRCHCAERVVRGSEPAERAGHVARVVELKHVLARVDVVLQHARNVAEARAELAHVGRRCRRPVQLHEQRGAVNVVRGLERQAKVGRVAAREPAAAHADRCCELAEREEEEPVGREFVADSREAAKALVGGRIKSGVSLPPCRPHCWENQPTANHPLQSLHDDSPQGAR
ncbi:hypothetical protein PybrP1_009600 [[Pythium] brassicae (nom. inval.)]|nr:hypothetical protein PybrP1_009600 [[Pythium] brassicae (nom. inval.)]